MNNPMEQLIGLLEKARIWEEERIYQRNDYLVKEGSRNTQLFYIVSGSVRIYMRDGLDEHCIRFGYKKSLIAALDSFISDRPTQLILQAIRKTQVKIISRERYMTFIRSEPQYTELWNAILESMIVQQMEREQDILIASPSDRYQRVLNRSPWLFQEIPHKYIASYLRMTPETLSRIKKS